MKLVMRKKLYTHGEYGLLGKTIIYVLLISCLLLFAFPVFLDILHVVEDDDRYSSHPNKLGFLLPCIGKTISKFLRWFPSAPTFGTRFGIRL